MTRRTAIVVVALVVAALVGVGLMAVPSSPLHQKPTLGLDLQGGLEITKQAVPPKGRKLTKEDLEPLGLDHARPRRPPRRLRARDPHAGQRPDHDPAAGRQGSRGGRQDHRQDGAARALRPRGEPRPAVDRHQRQSRAARLGLRPARRPAGARQGRLRPVVAVRQEEEARRRPGLDEGEGARQVRRQGARRLQALRDAQDTVVISCGVQAVVCPGIQSDTQRRTRTTCSSTRRRPCRR